MEFEKDVSRPSPVRSRKEPVLCPVCDGKNFSVLYEPWQDVDDPKALYGAASGVRGTQRIVKCSDCTMIYENPRFPESVILSGYSESDESGHDSQYAMRAESFYRTLKRLSHRLPKPPAKVLDIGTAGGAFLDAAKRFGYDAYGLEPSQFLTEQGVQRGLKIKCGTIDHHPFEEGEFDLICLWDVIEHLVYPKEALKKIRPLLKPGGKLLVNYPDIGTTQAKLAGEKFWWILSGHLHYFAPPTMKKILMETGFEPLCFKRYWQTLEFGYLEEMAHKLNVPFAKTIRDLTPQVIQKIPLSYYASQTTVIAELK